MKISDLIMSLQIKLVEKGDVEVHVWDAYHDAQSSTVFVNNYTNDDDEPVILISCWEQNI